MEKFKKNVGEAFEAAKDKAEKLKDEAEEKAENLIETAEEKARELKDKD
jgi:vacuolar-type H+-ATPase subunit H